MVKLSTVFLLTFVLRMQDCVECFQNIVIMNNKEMTYNKNGELVEFDVKTYNKKAEKHPVKIVEKSNLFKISSFVTGSKFMNDSKVRFEPTQGSRPFENQFDYTKASKVYLYSTVYPNSPLFLPTTTAAPPQLETTSEFNDDFTSTENFLHNTYDVIFKNDLQIYPPPVTDRPIESTIFIYSTPSPTTIVPVFLKKTKKKKKKTTTTPIPIHEHIVQNLDYYRKILALNCTKKEVQEKIWNQGGGTEQLTITITPKPTINIKVQSETGLLEMLKPERYEETTIEGKKDKKKKKKKKHCKKKHGHHHEHGHSHSESESEEHHEYESVEHNYSKKEHLSHQLFQKDSHEVHEHIHHIEAKKKKIPDQKHTEENSYDISLGHAGEFFDKFYGFFEDAMTSKEAEPYANHREVSFSSESEYDDSWGGGDEVGHHHIRKRSTKDFLRERDVDERKKMKRSINPRKSMKITVTSEYDDSIPGQTTPTNQLGTHLLNELSTTKPHKENKPDQSNSEESEEEYTLYDEIMGFRDDFDDSGDIDNEMKDDYSTEYYDDETPTNRLPDGDKIQQTAEDYSNENDAPSGSIFDKFTNMFSTLGSFFSSFTGKNDKNQKPPKEYELNDDYEDKGRATTEKVEQQSKRPKRENFAVPWYQPSFLFSGNNDKTVSSTTQLNWLKMPWQLDHLDEIATTTESSTTQSAQKKLSNTKLNIRSRKKNYNNYQLWRISPKSRQDANNLEALKMSTEGMKIHWLKGPSSKGGSDVIVPPDFLNNFKEFLNENSIRFDVKSRDIQYAIQYENPRINKRNQVELEVLNGHRLTWHRYHLYEDMQSFFNYLKRKFPNNVELIQIGWSFEGRPLTIVKVTHHIESNMLPKEPRSSSERPEIFIQSGGESHDWINVACATYNLNTIVNKMVLSDNDTASEIIKNFDFYFMPVMNPDGYDYSMNFERLWQKTRSRHFSSSNSFWSSAFEWLKAPKNEGEACCGVDPNRNFDYGWMAKGSSDNECSDFYGGPFALSEPETKLLSRFLLNSRRNIQLLVSLSGYGRKISFDSSKMSQAMIDDVRDIARAGVKNVKTAKFTIDSKAKRSGSIDQFASHQANIKFSFNLETRDDATNVFFVPASSIKENAKEMFDIIYGMVKRLNE